MTDNAPMAFRWDGEAMIPRSPRFADKRFVVGEVYRLQEVTEASTASRNHYFAALHDAWANLPDDLAVEFPTAEHLRKAALIKTGHRDERRFIASSPGEARKLASFLMPADEFAVISVAGSAVIEWKAKSQSARAMGHKAFQQSKQDVLEYVASLIGVDVEQLSSQAGKAA